MIEGKPLPAGKYSLFTIPHKDDTCTIIFNKEWDQWGHYKYNDAKDALRVDVAKVASSEETERLAFELAESSVILKWHNWLVPISIN